MKTGDLYQIMMSTVCRRTGVGELDMIESNKEECVDALSLSLFTKNIATYVLEKEKIQYGNAENDKAYQ